MAFLSDILEDIYTKYSDNNEELIKNILDACMDKVFETPNEDTIICVNNTYKQFAKKHNLKDNLFKHFIGYIGERHNEESFINLAKIL